MSSKPRRGRRAARETALRLLFEADVARRDPVALLDARRCELGLEERTLAYAQALVTQVSSSSASIDATIGRLAPAWPVGQMARLDVAILRIAISEIDNGNVPPPVAIAEAVELAKRYCNDGARRLINGALGTYVRGQAAPADV